MKPEDEDFIWSVQKDLIDGVDLKPEAAARIFENIKEAMYKDKEASMYEQVPKPEGDREISITVGLDQQDREMSKETRTLLQAITNMLFLVFMFCVICFPFAAITLIKLMVRSW